MKNYLLSLLVIFSTPFLSVTTAVTAADFDDGAASFDETGNLIRPLNWREWVFIGAALTPNDQNFGQAYLPEFKYVYLDPESFTVWKKSGEFREGAVLVKELVAIGSREEQSGTGYFPGEFLGLEVAVKNSRRFESHLGGWGFFSFGELPYVASAAVIRGSGEFDCSGCHAYAQQDMIFTQFYPNLNAAKPTQ
ncbi:MAG: cytochrome P460 [SAR86 cluster bacterium]|uniref:Cytochrome P460 n=1 Tax=SAR86 cluster bacterium TaxID=2030880 RepID=A0A2A4MUD6_9GAMM|nr:MAG: cytochrome P460 [SAR86 cluster bacterium]